MKPSTLYIVNDRKRKKGGKKSKKKRVGEKAKSEIQNCSVKILLSAHARTCTIIWQANVLHLDQKAVKCTTSKWQCGTF